MITICLTYFKSLTLANLAAALYSVRRQDLSCVVEIIIVDNDTADAQKDVEQVAASLDFPVPVVITSHKHGDPLKAHAWSTNAAVAMAESKWVLFTRADYLLDFDLVKRFSEVVNARSDAWDGFVVGHGCHLGDDITGVERTEWRLQGPKMLDGIVFDYTEIDSGVWMMRRDSFDRVGGLDERLSAWGHSQTEFQHRVFAARVEFIRLPQVLFWHPGHGGDKDINLAHAQLAGVGVDLKGMWKRYHGTSPY